MHKKPSTLALTLGAAVVGSTALTGTASAGENPFALRDLGGGYLQLASNEGGAEGRCGASPKGKEGACAGAKAGAAADKAMEGKCGEGKCGASMNMPAPTAAPTATPPPAAAGKAMEGKCGEGKCGASMNMPK